MQITVALDVSEKPGFAIFHETCLVRSGTLFQEKSKSELGPYPYNYIKLARKVADRVIKEVINPLPIPNKIFVVIEETTASSQNYSQKILEFIHFELLARIEALQSDSMVQALQADIMVCYVRDGVWKRIVGATQSKKERNWNARVRRYKVKNNKKIAKLVTEKGGKAHRVRKLNSKDYALRAVKDIYGLELSREKEDEADAILLGTAFLWGAPYCDGTDEGGVLTDVIKEILLANRCAVTKVAPGSAC